MRPKYLGILITLSFLTTACTTALDQQDMMGTWQVTDYDFSALEHLSPMMQSKAKEEALSTRYHLYQDQTFGVTSKFSEAEIQGNWSLLSQPNRLVLFHTSINYPETIAISRITKDSFVWAQAVSHDAQITFSVVRD